MRKRLLLLPIILFVASGMTTNAQDLSNVETTDSFLVLPDPGCLRTDAWTVQANPRSDVAGLRNHAFPDWNATYWGTLIEAGLGTVVTIHGRFPNARYMSLQVYGNASSVLDGLNDQEINPDPAQTNPFRGGTAQGTYTVKLVFGWPLWNRMPNTLYTFGARSVALVYRVYYPDNPNDVTGGAYNPVLPVVSIEGRGTLMTCAPRPIVSPEELTINGRVDDVDFTGAKPALFTAIPPIWSFQVTNPLTPFLRIATTATCTQSSVALT